MMKRLISILLVFLVLFSSLLSVKVVSAEEEGFDTDKEEISEVTDDTSDEEDISVVENETDINVEENSAPEPEPEETNESVSDTSAGAAYAILTEEGDLIFFRSEADYTNGSTYTIEINDIDYTGIIYTGIESISASTSTLSSIPWYNDRDLIKTVSVAKNQIIQPLSTSCWFYACNNLTSFNSSGFDTSLVTDMSWMFYTCYALTDIDLGCFDTSNVQSMGSMFLYCTSLESIDVSRFDTSNVTAMYSMFNVCSSLKSLDLSSFDTSSLKNMSYMFYGCSNLVSLDISSFNTSGVGFMEEVFNGSDSLISVSLGPKFTTWANNACLPEGTWTNGSISKSHTDLQQEYPSHAQEWAGTWERIISVETISLNESSMVLTVGDEAILIASILPKNAIDKTVSWVSSDPAVVEVDENGKVTALSVGTAIITAFSNSNLNIKANCEITVEEITPTSGTAYAVLTDEGDLIFFRSFESYPYTPDEKQDVIDIYDNPYSGYVYMGFETTFYSTPLWDSVKGKIKRVYVADNQIIKPFDMPRWFYGCGALESVDFTGFDTSSVTSMGMLFQECRSLKTLNINGIDTSNVTSMNLMFKDCGLTTADFSSLDTSKVTQFDEMFRGSSFVELDLRSFDTSRVEHMEEMFRSCLNLQHLDISSFDTQIANMNLMFDECDSLTSVVLGKKMTEWRGVNFPLGLPDGTWINRALNIRKEANELYQEYPSHATEWAGTWEKYIPVESLSLDESSITLSIGDEIALVASVLPENAFDKTVSWASSDSSIAEVDENGKVTALSVGTAIITAISNDKSSIKAQCEITVEEITPMSGNAYAVLTDKGDLIFFRSFETYENNTVSTVKDVYGNEYSGTVFSDVESSQSVPWADKRNKITGKAYVAEGQIISPTASMSKWFFPSKLRSFDGHGFDTSNVTDMSHMFDTCRSLTSIDLSTFDTGNVTTMEYMFGDCTGLTSLDLSSFNTHNVTNMIGMFNFAFTSSNLVELDLSSFDTRNVEHMGGMFGDCRALHTIKLGSGFTVWKDDTELPEGIWSNQKLDISKTEVELVEEYPSHASDWAGTWTRDISRSGEAYAVLTDEGDLIFFRSLEYYEDGETATAKDIYGNEFAGIVFSGFENTEYGWGSGPTWLDNFEDRKSVKRVYVSEGQIIHPISMTAWFCSFQNMVSFDTKGFDTSNVTSMYETFSECTSITSLDLRGFDTSKVKDMIWMFDSCYNLKHLDLSSFDTSNVEYMFGMFLSCRKLEELDLSSFVTANTRDMQTMFADCRSLHHIDISNFDTSNIQIMEKLFFGCDSLESINLGEKWTQWINASYLPAGLWSNGTIKKTEVELYNEYPSHAYEWAGTWTRSMEELYGDILPEDRPDDPDDIPTGLWTSKLLDMPYTGKAIKQDFRVYDCKTLLTEGTDYTAKYTNNTKAGTATITITGKGNYTGTLVVTFSILPLDISSAIVTLNKDVFAYTGKALKPTVSSVLYEGKKLKANTDYTISYLNDSYNVISNPILAGSYYVKVTGKGNYDSDTSVLVSYRIVPKSITPVNTLTVTLGYTKTAYDGTAKEPSVTIKKSKDVLDNSLFKIDYYDNVEVGTASVVVSSLSDDYAGSVTKTFTITGTALSKAKLTGVNASYTYTGEEIRPEPVLTYSSKTLVSGKDYVVSEYLNNIEIGTATILIEGRGGYTGTIKKTFKITGTSFSTKTIGILSGFESSKPFTGNEVRQDSVKLYLISSGAVLKPVGYDSDNPDKGDYTVSYKNNVNAGTATVTFTGSNAYTGSFSKTYKITKAAIKDSNVSVFSPVVYVKGGAKPLPDVTVNGIELENSKDYTLTYKNNTKPGTASITVKGKGNYEGSVSKSFTITPASISDVSITIPDKAYSNKANAWRSTPVLTDSNGKKLVSGTDYEKTIIYKLNGRELTKNDIVPEGSVIDVTVIGRGNYEGTKQGSYRIVTYDLSKATVTIPNQYYTGKPITLTEEEITVKIGKTLIDPSNYRIVEDSYVNNTAKGTAKVTIQGIGSCGGTKTASFKIVQRSLGIVIHFDGNGATSGTMKDQIVYKNNVALTKNAFKRTVNGVSIKFLGWNTKPDGSGTQYDTKYTDYSIFKAGQYITLYAMWEGGSSPEDPTGKPLRILQFVSQTLGGYSCEDMVYESIQRFCQETGSTVDTFELNYDDTHTDSSLDELCSSGRYDVIVTGYWSMEEYVERAALKYPDIKFLIFDCTIDFDRYPELKNNVSSYICKQNTLAFSAGALAALITESGKGLANEDKTIGFVGGGMITAIDDFLIGYIQGAHYIDPQIRVLYSYVGNWEDSDKAYELAHDQYVNGSDICFAVCAPASFGVCQQAYDDGVYALGVDTDHSGQLSISHPEQAGNTVSSAVKQFGYAIYDALVSVYDGSVRFGVNNAFGFESGYLQMIENDVFNSVFKEGMPEEYAAYRDVVQKLLNGEIDVGTAIGATQEYIENEKRKADPNP